MKTRREPFINQPLGMKDIKSLRTWRQFKRSRQVPKFLKDDLPLFYNIISDLFPGVEKSTPKCNFRLADCSKKTHQTSTESQNPKRFTLLCHQTWQWTILINSPFIDDFPLKSSTYRGYRQFYGIFHCHV